MKFIYGEEQYLIQKELNKFAKKQSVEPIIFNEEDATEDIVSEISTISMFESQKFIILKNISALSKKDEAQELIRALKTIDETVSVVVISEVARPLKTNELIKFLFSNADVSEVKKINDRDVVDLIRDIVASKGGQISNGAIITLSKKLPNNLRIIISEIDKLLLEANEITIEMIEISIGKYHIDDHYALSNAISSMDGHGIVLAYNKLKEDGVEPTMIIGNMASTLNLAILVAAYIEKGIPSKVIAEETKIHAFRIKKSIDLLELGSIKRIKTIVVMLAELDKNIKIGKVNKDIALDRFVLELIK